LGACLAQFRSVGVEAQADRHHGVGAKVRAAETDHVGPACCAFLRSALGVGGRSERTENGGDERASHEAAPNGTKSPKSPLASSGSQSMPATRVGTCWRSAHLFAARKARDPDQPS